MLKLYDHAIAVLQENLRITEHPNASRCTCQDDISRIESEGVRGEGDQRSHIEDHLLGVAVLKHRTVDLAANANILWVGDHLGVGDNWPKRAERIQALAAYPLAVAKLQIAGAYIVGTGVAENVAQGGLRADIARL